MAKAFKPHKIKIDQITKGIMTGLNTRVLLDGQVIRGVRSVAFNVEAGKIAEVTLKMIANLEIEGEIKDLETLVEMIGEDKKI